MKKSVGLASIVFLLTTNAYTQIKDSLRATALDEVVVSDTKFAQKPERSGKVIAVITAKELAQKEGQSLANVLSQIAGVEVNGNQSANGKNLGYYIRGGKNRQVLILIDGIPVTDASGISLEYDLRLLPVEQIEKIEVMKGASSTLWGTGAATGIINITLKKASKKGAQGNVYMNSGSNATASQHAYKGQDFNQGVSLTGTCDKITYFAGLNSTETNGMSQIAAPTSNQTYETDRFSRQNMVTKLGYKMAPHCTIDVFGNYDRVKNQYDFPFDNTGNYDTPINNTISEQFRLGITPKFNYHKGELVVQTGFTKITREYKEFNTYSQVVDISNYASRNVVLEAYNKYAFTDAFSMIIGVDYQFNDMSSATPYEQTNRDQLKQNVLDTYVNYSYNLEWGFNLNTGIRLNNHSSYGNNYVANFNPSYVFKTTFPLKVLASYSTAYITPSLYQLYGQYGNVNLTPEQNATLEMGFETGLPSKKVKWNTVAFYRDETNSIGFYFDSITYASYYVNTVGTHKAKGIETDLSVALSDQLQVSANYTFTQVDEALNRLIPKHKTNANINYTPTKRSYFNVSYQYFDARNDAFFDGNTYATTLVKLGSYQLLNATAKYELIPKRLTVFGAVTNIFNVDFVENVGYATRGRNFRLGLNIQL